MPDEKKQNPSRERELDEFWDLSELVPPKKNSPSRPHISVTLTEITSDGKCVPSEGVEQTRLTHANTKKESRAPTPSDKGADETVITRYIPPHTPEPNPQKPEPDDEYVPQGSMLHRIRIYRWKTSYQYYEDFCRHATALYNRHGEPCAPVAFFSYVPQYSQMNRAQLNWYLYWRDGVRRGEIMPIDYSYILLYIYEIINLSDTIDVHVGQQQLCALRKAFRNTYPRLGHLLNEWICDYSLIHHLPPPELEDLNAVADCTLKEFYVPHTEESVRYAASLMAFGSNYSYVKSKFAVGENRPLYDRHMLGALCACIADGGEVGKRMAGAGLEESRLIRDAYTGALCSHRVKRRIEIDYCSFARSHELRILVTDIMKYTENKLRAYLGVKSRLGLYALPQIFRDCIDRYLREALPQKARTAHAEPRREYDALYDVPKTVLSLTHAAEIEAGSWMTTERLISAFEDSENAEKTISEPMREAELTVTPETVTSSCAVSRSSTSEADEPDENDHLLQELSEWMKFINYALIEDAPAQRAFARERGEMIDSIADRINEIAADVIGDVLLEENDNGGYRVLEDYRTIFEANS